MKARPLNFDVARLDLESLKHRTRWSIGASTVLHVALFLLLTAAKPAQHVQDDLIEVTMIEDAGAPAAPAAAAPAASPHSGEPAAGAVDPQPAEHRFQRELARADVAPQPQVDDLADRITSRLASMRENTAPVSAGATIGAAPSLVASPATTASAGIGASPISLHRGGGLGGALALDRGGSGGGSSSAMGVVAPSHGNALQEADASHEDHAVRRAASADLMGPIADRRIVHQVTPVYPEWAKRDGVEGSVTLYFVVRADGSIRENVLIQKTAGFGDFDENARAALREWRFAALPAGETGEQWGTITLNYRLRGN